MRRLPPAQSKPPRKRNNLDRRPPSGAAATGPAWRRPDRTRRPVPVQAHPPPPCPAPDVIETRQGVGKIRACPGVIGADIGGGCRIAPDQVHSVAVTRGIRGDRQGERHFQDRANLLLRPVHRGRTVADQVLIDDAGHDVAVHRGHRGAVGLIPVAVGRNVSNVTQVAGCPVARSPRRWAQSFRRGASRPTSLRPELTFRDPRRRSGGWCRPPLRRRNAPACRNASRSCRLASGRCPQARIWCRCRPTRCPR